MIKEKDRVHKTVARKLYENGHDILVMPRLVARDNIYGVGFNIHKCSGNDFDNMINEIEYYSCNSELGKYVKYYDLGFRETEEKNNV